MASSIRELVDQKIGELRNLDQLDPQTIAQKIIELSALWASVNKELAERKFWYAEKKKLMLIEHGKAAQATIYAEASPEYHDLLIADAYAKSIQETIRSGKKFINLVDSEMREAKY